MVADFRFNFKEPIVCTAIHNGHDVSYELIPTLAISEETRLLEEDPRTELFAGFSANRIIGRQSRFEVDLNRVREKAVYLHPEDAWGLSVRNERYTSQMINSALTQYDLFYRRTEILFREMLATHGYFFVYDIHSYNHHRQGLNAPFDDPEKNPEIILGTSNMSESWLPLVGAIKSKIEEFSFEGRALDVRVNVKFPGGNFSRWIHRVFPENVCSIAIEFKKIFMNEWTGEFYHDKMELLKQALESTKPLILKYLNERLGKDRC